MHESTSKTIETTAAVVTSATRQGVRCVVGNETKFVGWRDLVAATTQTDPEYRDLYVRILAEARKMAPKVVSVVIANRTNTPHGYCAELRDVSGEFMTGRIVGAAWGQDMNYSQACAEAREAQTKLTSNGYDVQIDLSR